MEILPQPTDSTCGPTCLHAVYRAFGDDVPLDALIEEVPTLEGGGTLGVLLANHALRRGYRATIYTYNLKVFDPTWFADPTVQMVTRLEDRRVRAGEPKLEIAAAAYLEYLRLGGEVRLEDLTPRLLAELLGPGRPVLAGVSATYLYRTPRERDGRPDDAGGDPVGHFVVLHGHDPVAETVSVADPYAGETPFEAHYYPVDTSRLVNALLLGIVTYDANLIVLRPGVDS